MSAEPPFPTDPRVEAVLALHSKRVFNGDGYGWSVCAECRQAWPCATVAAVEAVEAVGNA